MTLEVVNSTEQFRDELCERTGFESLVFLTEEEYDTCVVGVSLEGQVIYDEEAIRMLLQHNHGMDAEEARDYFDFNIAGSYIANGPVFITVTGCRAKQ